MMRILLLIHCVHLVMLDATSVLDQGLMSAQHVLRVGIMIKLQLASTVMPPVLNVLALSSTNVKDAEHRPTSSKTVLPVWTIALVQDGKTDQTLLLQCVELATQVAHFVMDLLSLNVQNVSMVTT